MIPTDELERLRSEAEVDALVRAGRIDGTSAARAAALALPASQRRAMLNVPRSTVVAALASRLATHSPAQFSSRGVANADALRTADRLVAAADAAGGK